MAWEAWVLIAVYVVAALSAVYRAESTGTLPMGAAVFVLVLDAGLVWLVLRLAGVS